MPWNKKLTRQEREAGEARFDAAVEERQKQSADLRQQALLDVLTEVAALGNRSSS
jgi:hypothetical protein